MVDRQWLRNVALTWVVLVAAVGVGLAVPTGPAGAAPLLTVTPSTDLVDGQVVTVDLDGLAPNGFVGVLQCAAGLGIDGCDLSGLRYPEIDENGTGTVAMPVYAILVTRSGIHDCRVEQCLIGAGANPEGIDALTADLAFDPDAPLMPPPTVTVDPATGLVDGQEVDVTITGGRVQTGYAVTQCAVAIAGYAGCREWTPWLSTDATGAGGTTLGVLASFRAAGGAQVDCRAAGTCEIRVLRQGTGEGGSAATEFEPGAPLTTDPTATATPATGLVDRQVVTVTGSGWPTGGYASVSQCTIETVFVCRTAGYGEVGSDGTITIAVAVDAPLFIGGTTVDCRTAPGRCELRVTASDEEDPVGRDVWVPLTFDPDAPFVPPPTVTVTPDTDLVDGQWVTVSGTGLIDTAGTSVGPIIDGAAPGGAGTKLTGSATIVICDAADPTFDRCSYSAYTGVSHEDGAFTTPYAVPAAFLSQGQGVVDCREPGTTCELRVGQIGNPQRSTEVTLSFDPDAPLRPPATMAVSPSAGLVDRDRVTVDVQGWTAGYGDSAWQCRPGWADSRDCQSLPQYLESEAPGTISGTVTVRAIIRTSTGPFDCRTVPSCDLVVGYPEPEGSDPDLPPVDRPPMARAAISFDPNGPLRQVEVLGLEPTHPVVDGQITTLRARYLSPYTRFDIRQCRDSGDLTGFTCDESTKIQSWADENGEIAPWVVAHRMLTMNDGTTTDCTVDRCVLLLEVPVDAAVALVPIAMTDGSPPPADPTDPPAQTPTTPTTTPTGGPTTTSTTRPSGTSSSGATPSSSTPRFTG